MPVLNSIETALENLPALNQEVGPNNTEYLNAGYLNHFSPPSPYFSQLKIDLILSPKPVKLKVIFIQFLNSLETAS